MNTVEDRLVVLQTYLLFIYINMFNNFDVLCKLLHTGYTER